MAATIDKFRSSFVKYLETDLKIDIPSELKSVDNLTFATFVMSYVLPYRDNWDEGYSQLKSFIESHGKVVPDLTKEEKAKIIRFLEAFCEIVSGDLE